MQVPEVLGQLAHAGVKQAEIIQRAVVFVILRRDAGDRALDAQVDVLGHEHHGRFGLGLFQREDGVDDVVVGDVVRVPRSIRAIHARAFHRLAAPARFQRAGLEMQPADAFHATQLQAIGAAQHQSRGDLVGALRLDQLVDETADLARIAAGLGGPLLAAVEFLDHLHRQEHVVFLELEQRGRVVHQHIGVEYVDTLAFGHHVVLLGVGWGGKNRRRQATASRVAGQWHDTKRVGVTWPGSSSMHRARPARGRAP